MALVKAVKVIFIRELIARADSETQATFFGKLTEREKTELGKILSFSKVTVEFAEKIFEAAAAVLHPGKPDGVVLLGKALALDNLTGVYRILLRFMSIPFLIKQAGKLWDTYHEKGIARCARVKDENAAFFLIEDFPDMSKTVRDITTGYIEGALDLTGGKQIRVELDESNPQLWKWRVTWGAEKLR